MGGFKLMTLFGIPIRVTVSFLMLLGFALLAWGGLQGVVAIVAMFTMVLAHELGHALVARKFNVPILGIDLHFFGGAAKLAYLPSSPRQEILIAAAGPAVSFALAAASFALFVLTDVWVLRWLAYINFVLGAFNLLPALPMDGGRIFRAALSHRLGRARATALAVKVAKGVAVALGVVGGLGLWPFSAPSFFMVGLAVMLWWMASSEMRAAAYQETMGQAGVGGWGWPQGSNGSPPVEVLDRDGRPVGQGGSGQTTSTRPGWGNFTVEEQRGQQGVRYYVVRSLDGRVIFRTHQPHRW